MIAPVTEALIWRFAPVNLVAKAAAVIRPEPVRCEAGITVLVGFVVIVATG